MQRIRVLLLFGGESTEHEVSLASARNVYAALDDRKYDISLGYITKDGHWRLIEDIESLESGAHQHLLPVLGGRHFSVQPRGTTIVPDVILPILHGLNGEDGTVQGLAKLLHIPVVGCGILGSALCMDKEVAKRLLKAAKVPVLDYAVHFAHEPRPDFAQLTLQLGNPVFVKPANAGSSVGVSKAYDDAHFTQALEHAHKHDKKVLIEQAAVDGRELECAVLGNEHPEASGVGEVVPDREFYSYDSKYDPESTTKLIIPADLAEETVVQIRELALKAYAVLECRGLARVDFFMTPDGKVYLNELNTMPGFTNISMYAKLWRASGLSYPALIDKLVNLALE